MTPAVCTYAKFEVPQDDSRRPMSIAALKKRLQSGVRVRWTWAHYSGPREDFSHVNRVQTNAVTFTEETGVHAGRDFWLQFTKGKKAEETDAGFRIIDEDGNTTLIGEWA